MGRRLAGLTDPLLTPSPIVNRASHFGELAPFVSGLFEEGFVFVSLSLIGQMLGLLSGCAAFSDARIRVARHGPAPQQ
jgi:hypothetical protein